MPQALSEQVVVGAVLFYQQKLFIAQRVSSDQGGGLWEFPGGKVEVGESESQALEREIKEELDVCVRVKRFLAENKFVSSQGKKYLLKLFHCDYFGDKIKLQDHQDSQWVTLDQVYNFKWTEPDLPLVPKVVEYLNGLVSLD